MFAGHSIRRGMYGGRLHRTVKHRGKSSSGHHRERGQQDGKGRTPRRMATAASDRSSPGEAATPAAGVFAATDPRFAVKLGLPRRTRDHAVRPRRGGLTGFLGIKLRGRSAVLGLGRSASSDRFLTGQPRATFGRPQLSMARQMCHRGGIFAGGEGAGGDGASYVGVRPSHPGWVGPGWE